MVRMKPATSIFALLLLAAPIARASGPVCGDVNQTRTVTATDALLVLRKAVSQPVGLVCEADQALAVCEADLVACLALPAAQVLQTGQKKCYDDVGAEVSCVGTGHDGETRYGAAHTYVDNGDGTLTDGATGLTWEKLDDNNAGGVHDRNNTYDWSGAFAKILALNTANFAGHNDWRLPNRRELESLVTLEFANPAVDAPLRTPCTPDCVSTTCSCQPVFGFWSSSTHAIATTQAWGVNFADGDVFVAGKMIAYGVRAVRGGA